MIKKLLLVLGASTALVASGGLAPAQAADGDQFVVNGNFSAPTVNGLLDTPNTTTGYTLAVPGLFGNWANRDLGSMYDAGRYTIASNPASLHEFWAEFPEGDPKLIVNGFTEGSQTVWAQDVNLGAQCATGSEITYQFRAEATNILRPGIVTGEAGANLSVEVNGNEIGSADLTGSDPTNLVEFTGNVAYASPLHIEIINNATAYSGNDFAIDDITLTQMGGCEPPCVEVTTGKWHVYNGVYPNNGTIPSLSDSNWHETSGNPQSANHSLATRGLDHPYWVSQGSKGKGDWFVWKSVTVGCDA